MVLVSFSLRIMVFTDSLWHALERDIGHECRPFLLGIQITLCELQFSAYLKVPGRSFDARKILSFQCRITLRLFCRSYGSADILTREKLELARKIVFIMESQKEMQKKQEMVEKEEMVKKQEMVEKEEMVKQEMSCWL